MNKYSVEILKKRPDEIILLVNNQIKRITLKTLIDGSKTENEANRYKSMYDNNAFQNVELSIGDIVWPGWCEIFNEDLLNYAEDIDENS